MSQLTVYRNKNPRSRAEFPYLIDIQSDLLSDLRTRVVIPLCSRGWLGIEPITKLMPEVEIEGERLLALTPQLAGVSIGDLGDRVTEVPGSRSAVLAALDFLITGF